jgi:copper resistance protein C
VVSGAATTKDDGRTLVIPLKTLPPGTYQVEWHVTSVDTHKTEGHFVFSVKP